MIYELFMILSILESAEIIPDKKSEIQIFVIVEEPDYSLDQTTDMTDVTKENGSCE